MGEFNWAATLLVRGREKGAMECQYPIARSVGPPD